MIKIVSCGCYVDLVLHMKNVSLEIFYGGVSGCLSLICEITRMRERLKRSCTDFMSIDNDSIIFACFDCLKDQIFITVRKRFVASLLKMECFNSKMKAHTHCINATPFHCFDAMFVDLMTVHEICYGCLIQCCKRFLFKDFHRLLLEWKPCMKSFLWRQ